MLNTPKTVPTYCPTSIPNLIPQRDALQSSCKQILKEKIFRGFYEERRYVDVVGAYRDIIALEGSEHEFQKILMEIRQQILLFYQNIPNVWIGITHGDISKTKLIAGAMDTYIWVELENVAFGQYWFMVKSVRFRDNEIILKLKVARAVETELTSTPLRRRVSPTVARTTGAALPHVNENDSNIKTEKEEETIANEVGLQDFINVIFEWGRSIKHTTYEFMSNDISKENIVSTLKFIGLITLSLVTAFFAAIKFVGAFVLRFMFELSRLTRVLTPIILKLIDVFNKIVGGFYILLAMIWKDTVGRREPQVRTAYPAIEYNRPMYKSIKYNVEQSRNSQNP
ncbi:uncharacterized protein LOC119680219 isoform X1 [Teleopsis dalmanni]|uniref:uncharacterized protein LOC119680219 isoform X1 n=1 Tax=Teleopsis dalmanni TaxID=139649 RepID=UPI0018CF00F2|nr:uncharacterized protein LOC119680219 isoform X1 [Teleopsis dalmanni]XP_037948858.1 uncharacterized protein LOC119680219 isoform X1 [Teleopsis dalmanni]